MAERHGGQRLPFAPEQAERWQDYGFSALRTEEGVLGRSDTQYLLSMSVPLGRGTHPVSFSADLGVRDRGGYDNSRVGITGSAGVDNNFSYGVALSDSREEKRGRTALLFWCRQKN